MEIKYLQVLVMPNNEVLCSGKTIGKVDELENYLCPVVGDLDNGEIVISLENNK